MAKWRREGAREGQRGGFPPFSSPLPPHLPAAELGLGLALARDKKNGRFRDRRGHVLFIDARKLGRMVDRTHRELTDEDIAGIAGMYHLWRGEKSVRPEYVEGRTTYEDIPGFCKSATLEEIRKHGHVLTPGRYRGSGGDRRRRQPFEEKMKRLTAKLEEQFAESARLAKAILANLKGFGYDE